MNRRAVYRWRPTIGTIGMIVAIAFSSAPAGGGEFRASMLVGEEQAAAPNALAASLDAGNIFDAATSVAQRRTVKVYGAGIGRASGYASGIIVSPDGLIATAYGVYLTGERIRVSLPDGGLHDATLVRKSGPWQLALLKIDHPTPDFFNLSETPTVAKGDWVLGVSNAFKVAEGPEPLSVNVGVVSLRTRLVARLGAHDVEYQGDALLIDAITSNPGAPGGAVVTVDGRLAGMIGRVIESKSAGTRLNYAVPTELLRAFVNDEPAPAIAAAPPTQNGKSDLGLRLFRQGGRRAPAYVDRVIGGGPAAAAGVKTDDLVISIGGQAIRDAADFERIATGLAVGEETSIVVKRGEKLTPLKITPRAMP